MIEVEHLSKLYGSKTAIEDVSFQVEKGEILGLLGPNGAGKTTTMRILSGYLPATDGIARVAGYEVHENPMAVRRCIGYLPENPPLYLEMTIEGYLSFVSRIKGIAAGDRDRCINSALALCGLEDHRTDIISKLSKGYRQRVGIAQAIVHEPDAIILDEPTVGLDPRQIIEVRNLIRSLAGDRTIILSSHILPEVRMTCDHVAIIHQGRVVASDSLLELINPTASKLEYEIEISGEQHEAQDFLLNLDQVESVSVLSQSLLDPQHIRFKVKSIPNIDLAPMIAHALIDAGFKLYELKKNRASLEEVFLNLTMEEQSLSGATEEVATSKAPHNKLRHEVSPTESSLDNQTEDHQPDNRNGHDID